MNKLRPIFKCHGGKFYLRDWIISHFPKNYEELHYIEGCGGAASVLLNKQPSKTETYNDADPNIAGIVKSLIENENFIDLVRQVEYSEAQFIWSIYASEHIEGVMRFVGELVRRRFSRGGMRKAYAWSERLRGGNPGDLNAWNTFLEQLPAIAKRLSKVEVTSLPVAQLFQERDSENTLWYIDPPYLPETRRSPQVYTKEMTKAEHIQLAEVLNTAKGKVIISGYQSPLYNAQYSGWSLKCKPIANHSSQSKTKQHRIECLWMNY